MKFTCEKNALVSAISVASRTVAQKSTIPALEGIYIRAGVKLTLSGYNLETGITISVDADIQETGACIMPSRLFFDIIRKLPDDTVSISVDENFKVSIRGGISSFSITAMSSEDYPELPEVDSEKGIDLPQSELKAMIGTGEKIQIDVPELDEATLARLDALPHVTRTLYREGTLELACQNGTHNVSDVLAVLQRDGAQFGRIYAEPPTLNDVFLEITGKALRD